MLSILATEANWVLPPQASTIAPEFDWLMYFILWVCVIFSVLIFAGTAWLAWRYRHRPGVNDIGSGPTHSNFLEIFWSVIPFVIVVLIAIWGFDGYLKYAVLPPAEAMEVQVEGYKWGWRFTYPNGHTEPELHVPKDKPVRLVMTSVDVIHSLYFPDFRVKKDVVPGRYNKFWFTATMQSPLKDGLKFTDPSSFDPSKGGDPDAGFQIFCTEYCGTSHSKMLSRVHVHPDESSYNEWMKQASNIWRPGPDGLPPKTTEVGLTLAKKNGCFSCHSIDGTAGTGPTWKNLFNHTGKFTDGTEYTADENYIRESIFYPQKHIVAGFGGAMGSYLGKISDREVTALIQYMKSISENYKGDKGELDAPVPDPAKK